jgi:8-oxo-dGTP pyrophosphatase MutT (NUDIX family)
VATPCWWIALVAGPAARRSVRLASMGQTRVMGVHHVVAGLLVEADKVFLCHRSAGRRWYPNVWDLPGGHVEQNEAPAVLYEELGS